MVATGGAVMMGTTEDMKMTFYDPVRGDDIIRNVIEAGEYWGIGIGASRLSRNVIKTSEQRLEAVKSQVESGNLIQLSKDAFFGEMYYLTAMLYNARMDGHDASLAYSLGVESIRLPSEAIVKTAFSVHDNFGVPISASISGLQMDSGRAGMTLD